MTPRPQAPKTPRPRRRVGLLGGSFNPAHAGHVHISLEALKRLKLDEIWWLVSPGNPLKSAQCMAPFEQRFASAQALCKPHKRLKASTIEQQLGTRYTIDTLQALRKRFPRVQFVWLMGADNLAQFHRWQGWRRIARLVPIAVMDRAPYSYASLKSQMAIHYLYQRLAGNQSRQLAHSPLPAWVYLPVRRDTHSSTAIRKQRTIKIGEK